MAALLGMGGLLRQATTTSGNVIGLVNDGVIQFKGVPYGAPTGAARRYRDPEPAPPWRRPRECFGYGHICPQVPTGIGHQYGRLIQFDMVAAEGGMGEDCLNLNLWTCGLRDGRKRPVIVSIHGGGFSIASGNARIYDGARLAKSGDVVVVTISHRLSSFGFLNLLDQDQGHPTSPSFAANPGLADLVLALQWVRENIENFGGDPDRVMIWGQSGGGWKVSALLALPPAQGLFSRAVVQSGSLVRFQEREAAAAVAAGFIAALGLTRRNLAKLRTLPWPVLLEAQTKVGAQAFTPFLDGRYITQHAFDPVAPAQSADVPLIVSTTRDDAGLFFSNFALDEAGLMDLLRQQFDTRAQEIRQLYRDGAAARATPFLLYARIITDAGFRRFAYMQTERKAQQGAAPVYLYQWNWPSPAYDGMFGAVHAIDVAAAFGNARDAIVGGGCEPGRSLSRALSSAWIAFAADGKPGAIGVVQWKPYTATNHACLVIDDPIALVDDPDREIREFWEQQPAPASVLG